MKFGRMIIRLIFIWQNKLKTTTQEEHCKRRTNVNIENIMIIKLELRSH